MIGDSLIDRVVCPTFAFEPNGMTAGVSGRNNIFVDTVAYNDNFLRLQPKGLNTEGKDTGIGLSDAHYSRFYNLREDAIKTKLTKHCLDIAVEITDKHHGIAFL